MKIYDALIIGSCYRALGYALTKGNSVIVEEREMCDTQLCVPIYSFERDKEEPTTELGKSLNLCTYDRTPYLVQLIEEQLKTLEDE